jgi:hypothetical protein
VYLQELGAEVDLRVDPQIESFKNANGVPEEVHSCHTAVVDGYIIEGHVPAGAILRLLAERPDAIGIAVPGMPEDSPGMGGNPTTWEAQQVVLITNSGKLRTFDY